MSHTAVAELNGNFGKRILIVHQQFFYPFCFLPMKYFSMVMPSTSESRALR